MIGIKHSLKWFEIPVTDFDRAKDFYSFLYDYEMPSQQMGDTIMGFLPCEEGGIGGAICQGEHYKTSKDGALIYLNGGTDLQVILDRVVEAGGKILNGKAIITDELGYLAKFEDSEGNIIALHSRH